MSIRFREAGLGSLESLTVEAPDGATIGVIGEEISEVTAVLRLAAGMERAERGEVVSTEPRRYLGPLDPLNLAPAGTLALDHTLARYGALVRARSRMALERLRRSGTTILLASAEEELLISACDEIWWVSKGRIAAKGDPREVLTAYQRDANAQLREWAMSVSQPLAPSLRRGDGRAELVSIETLDEAGTATMAWSAGSKVAVRVRVRFHDEVADPVVGMMIRTRIGFEVFGTNTELEGLKLGPVAAGESREVTFSFRCDLCPRDYTLTAASHDPNGVWHDWLEDAVAFSVTDTRYTAGVANLKASATWRSV